MLFRSQELNSPVILGVSEGAGKYMGGYHAVVGMVNGLLQDLNITVPVALHLDHGTFEGCYKCIEAGFSSIMFDGSHYAIDENVAKTTELVKAAHDKGLSIEAEVGSIGGEEDGVVGMGECADPDECKAIADLGIDFLAAGIGNIHGKYPENWKGLSFETLDAVQQKTGDMPLVLHGGTGIPADMIKKAISLGVAKINVNTECQLAFAAATRKYVEEGKDLQGKGFDPRKLLAPGAEAIKATVKDKMELFGSVYSPVIAEVSRLLSPFTRTPSTGICSPLGIKSISCGNTYSVPMRSCSPFSLSRKTVLGDKSIRDFMARLVLLFAFNSRYFPKEIKAMKIGRAHV